MISRTGVAVIALACASCSVEVIGSPAPPVDTTGPLTAAEALGDYATINYCSLVDKDSFPDAVGQVVVYPSPSFDVCTFTVRTSGGDVEVHEGNLATSGNLDGVVRLMPDRSRTLPRELQLETTAPQDLRCDRYLKFSDELFLEVHAFVKEYSSQRDVCPVADAGRDQVVSRVLEKKVEHFNYGPKSLGRVNACWLVSTELLKPVVGADPERKEFPGSHVCGWWQGSETAVELAFIVDLPPGARPTDETIAGRRTRVIRDPSGVGLSECQLVVDRGSSPEAGGDELIELTVLLAGKGKDPCVPARTLAASVWPKLS